MRVHSKDIFGAFFDLGQAFAQYSDVTGLEMQASKDADCPGLETYPK